MIDNLEYYSDTPEKYRMAIGIKYVFKLLVPLLIISLLGLARFLPEQLNEFPFLREIPGLFSGNPEIVFGAIVGSAIAGNVIANMMSQQYKITFDTNKGKITAKSIGKGKTVRIDLTKVATYQLNQIKGKYVFTFSLHNGNKVVLPGIQTDEYNIQSFKHTLTQFYATHGQKLRAAVQPPKQKI